MKGVLEIKSNLKEANSKYQPELGACPCMSVGGFKRKPTGFSSGKTKHNIG